MHTEHLSKGLKKNSNNRKLNCIHVGWGKQKIETVPDKLEILDLLDREFKHILSVKLCLKN